MSEASSASSPAARPDANVTVAKNIRAELALAEIGQVDLANHLGQNEMWISRRMKGAPAFSTNEVADIADFFGIPVGDLFVHHERRLGATGRRALLRDVVLSGPWRDRTADIHGVNVALYQLS